MKSRRWHGLLGQPSVAEVLGLVLPGFVNVSVEVRLI